MILLNALLLVLSVGLFGWFICCFKAEEDKWIKFWIVICILLQGISVLTNGFAVYLFLGGR